MPSPGSRRQGAAFRAEWTLPARGGRQLARESVPHAFTKGGFWTLFGAGRGAGPLQEPALRKKRTRDEGRNSGSAEPEFRYFLGKADLITLCL